MKLYYFSFLLSILFLTFLSFIQYIIRISLENDAMIKAKYVAKDYIEENKLLNKNEEEMLLEEYDRVNKIGIPFMNFHLISKNIIKDLIYALIVLL